MPLRLPELRIELRWWWEERGPGEAARTDDVSAARLDVGRLGRHPDLLAAARAFLRRGEPWLQRAPDDAELLDRLARAIAGGQVRVAPLAAERLGAVYTEAVAEAAVERVVTPAPEPAAPVEEICWPCLQRAAASARALRSAASEGLPFIADG